jgi:AhpD family alkylhydroperoxidase
VSGTALPDKEANVPDSMYPRSTRELTGRRTQAAPETHEAFQAFSRQVFADGALSEKTKQLIAVAVAHVTQCPYCIRGHARLAQRRGASEQEIMEAIWVAAEMRAGGAYAHSVIALDALAAEDGGQRDERAPASHPEPTTTE